MLSLKRKIPPYITQHIDVGDIADKELPFPLLHEAGYYCFFWWKEIPLGHFFLYRNQKSENYEIRKRIITAIEATVDFYITRHETRSLYRKAFLRKEPEVFKKLMEEIFSAYHTHPVPEMVDVSVVICTRNRSKDLDLCLQSILNQACRPKEIIVVDNAPSGEETKKVVAQYEKVTYCEEPRLGLSNARNTGIHYANCPIIAWTDDDVTVHPLWTYRIWEVFQVPDIVAATGLVLPAQLNTESQQIFELYWTFNRGYTDKVFDTIFFQNKLHDGPPVWEIGAGANMAFRKLVFNEVGFFDERLGAGASGCSEDSEMWYRILAKGHYIHYTPRSVVFHKHREEMKVLKKQLYNYMKGFTVAALIQQTQDKRAGYRRHILFYLPKYFLRLFREGFPAYRFRYRSLPNEIQGYIAGFLYYRKHRKKPAQTDTF